MSMDESIAAKTPLESFHDNMYYNGDAVWYFLTEVYSRILLLEEPKSPIPFTISGENIPKNFVTWFKRMSCSLKMLSYANC